MGGWGWQGSHGGQVKRILPWIALLEDKDDDDDDDDNIQGNHDE